MSIDIKNVLIENQDENMRYNVAYKRPLFRVEVRSSQVTCSSVKASQLGRRRLNMHAQVVCVDEQV